MAELNPYSIDRLLQDKEVARNIKKLKEMNGVRQQVPTYDSEEEDNIDDFDFSILRGVMFTAIYGMGDVKDQSVHIECLTTNQLLIIPAGLGMNPFTPAQSQAKVKDLTIHRFLRATTLTYRQIKAIVEGQESVAQKRTAFDAIEIPAAAFKVPDWTSPGWYLNANAQVDSESVAHHTFSIFSRIMGFNFDVRDMGYLTYTHKNNRVADGQWMQPLGDLTTLLLTQVQPYTLNCIAALNWDACDQWDIGGWVRAFGVGCGVLPDEATRLNKEWKYTRMIPSNVAFIATRDTHAKIGPVFKTYCLNIIAMFGLFHLEKNNTFRTNDRNMKRVGISYIKTLGTMVSSQGIQDLKSHQEVAVRTASHPFGLGQSYWLAKALHAKSELAIPLSLRLDVTPPTVQRLMTVDAAARGWRNLPISKLVNWELLDTIAREIETIRQNPPAYSELHAFYGITNRKLVTAKAKEAADAMMVLVNRFAKRHRPRR